MSVGTEGRNTHLRLYHGVKPTGRFAFRTLEDSDFLTGLVRLNANEPHRLAAPQARKNSKLGPAVQWVWLNRCHLPSPKLGGSATDLSVADNCLSGAAMEPFSLTHRGGPGQYWPRLRIWIERCRRPTLFVEGKVSGGSACPLLDLDRRWHKLTRAVRRRHCRHCSGISSLLDGNQCSEGPSNAALACGIDRRSSSPVVPATPRRRSPDLSARTMGIRLSKT